MYKKKYLKYKKKYTELKGGESEENDIQFPELSYGLIDHIGHIYDFMKKIPKSNLPPKENIERRVDLLNKLWNHSMTTVHRCDKNDHKEAIKNFNNEIKKFNFMEDDDFVNMKTLSDDDIDALLKISLAVKEHLHKLPHDAIHDHKLLSMTTLNEDMMKVICKTDNINESEIKEGGGLICGLGELIDNVLALIPLEGIIEDAIGIVIALFCGDIFGALLEMVGLIPIIGEIPRVIQVLRDIMNII